MTIGIDFSRSLDERRTGVEWYSYYLLQEFLKMALANPADQFIFYFRDTLPTNTSRNIVFKKVPGIKIKNRAWLWTQLGLSFELLRHHPEVLFVPSHALPVICPSRAVITIHDIGFLRNPEWYPELGRIYHHWALNFAIKHAKKIIVPSEFTKQELLLLTRAKSAQIVVTPLGFNQGRYHQHIDRERQKEVLELYGLRDKAYFINIGRREEKKNIYKLLKAFCFEEFHNMDLVLVGPKGFNYEKISTMLPRPNVKELNYVPEEDLPFLLHGATALLMPSLYEGFGLPPLQAMGVGTPVMISNTGSLPEICDGAAMVVDPYDENDIKRGMIELLDEETRQTLIKKGLERVKQFSWEKTARETFEVLRNLKN